MTKWLLKSSYRRMLPMELRKFFLTCVLTRCVLGCSESNTCTWSEMHDSTEKHPLCACPLAHMEHTDMYASFTFTALFSGFIEEDSICQTLLRTTNIIMWSARRDSLGFLSSKKLQAGQVKEQDQYIHNRRRRCSVFILKRSGMSMCAGGTAEQMR